jgi:hypothetical protein
VVVDDRNGEDLAEFVQRRLDEKSTRSRTTTRWLAFSKENPTEEELVTAVDTLLALPRWKSDNGRTVRVDEMDDQHIDNTIRMLQRMQRSDGRKLDMKQSAAGRWIKILEEEKVRRGI